MSCLNPSSKVSPSLEVSCAIIEADGLVLAARRGEQMAMPGKWEFPGGKLRPGESPVQGIVREIKEELDLKVQVQTGLEPCTHNYPGLRVRLHPFVCWIVRGRVCLREHQEVCWIA
ncbi:MAG: (deoxy)nucleoside triphosphate pyrophosphohydrolase, partial [Desulfohalobiaceae bacterium]